MLVLSRKQGETLVIEVDGKLVSVEVSKIKGSRVVFGVEAPEILISRGPSSPPPKELEA